MTNASITIRDYYKGRSKWYVINLLIAAVIITGAYFIFEKPRYDEHCKYLDDNRKMLYDRYYDEVEEEVRKKNIEDDEKFWTINRDAVKKKFEYNLTIERETERYFFAVGAVIVLIATFPISNFIVGQPLYCKHCLKTVLPDKIVPFVCPFCHTENKYFRALYTKCKMPECKSIIPSVPCPHCNKQIDFLGEYDIEKIKIKRYGKKI